MKELQLATGSDREAASNNAAAAAAAGATPHAHPAPFAEAARSVHAQGVAVFRRAFAEDLQLDGTEWDGRAAALAFEKDLTERVAVLREERVSGGVPACTWCPEKCACFYTYGLEKDLTERVAALREEQVSG